MKRVNSAQLLGLALLTGILSCQNPLKDVNILVSSEILKYTAMLHVTDAFGNPQSDLTVTIRGRDAEYVYNLDGRKQFTLQDGLVGLGIHPKHEPTPGNPVVFQVELSGANYFTQLVPVVIVAEQFSMINAVSVINLEDTPPGVSVYAPSISLTGNATTEPIVLTTPAQNAAAQTMQITLPAGTQFLDENGNVLSGSELKVSIVNADTDKPGALKIFPGGNLATDGVFPAGSSTAVSGTFNPAALTNIEFFLDGGPVRQFSQPIQISQQLDPNFVNTVTEAPVAPGDQLTIYSYSSSDAHWRYERETTVSMVDGMPVSTFETDHLTWYMSGNFMQACTEPAAIQLDASWFSTGVSYPLTVEAVVAGKVVQQLTLSANADNRAVQLNNLPTKGVRIQVSDDRGALLGDVPLNSVCGGTTAISLTDPVTVADPTVTLQLYVRCPGQKEVITVLPTFYLYYNERGVDDGYKFLGVVTNGFISTKLLKIETAVYNFKAVWGNQVKIVGGHRLKADNSGTVGIEPGDIIGEKDGANNLSILTEKCNEL